MKKDQAFHDYVMADLFGYREDITSRAMFGGWGIYCDGLMFALIVDGELHFKVDDNNRAFFDAAGSHPFTYGRQNKRVSLSYFSVPESIMEDHEAFALWTARSIAASHNKKPRR